MESVGRMRLWIRKIWNGKARQFARNNGAPVVAFSATLALLLFNLAEGAWLSDESYYMMTGQGYAQFLLNPNREILTRHVLSYLHTPSDEAAGLVNHPFLAKLVIGVSLLISGSKVPNNFLKPTPTQLFWGRLPSTLIASLSMFVIYYLVYSRFGAISATLAGVFLISDATFLQYSRLAMLDVYAATFMIASFGVLISSSSLEWKQLCASALLAGLMVASKFTPGVFASLLVMLSVVFNRRGLKGLFFYLAIGMVLFLIVDFYYLFLSPLYLFNAFLGAGRPVPQEIGVSHGAADPFHAMFSWGAYYSISHTWSVVEVALVVLSLVLAAFLMIKRTCDNTEIDVLFLANITLGFVSFSWERPLVLLAPVTALFISTTIARFIREFVPARWALLIQGGAIIALLIQLAAIVREAYFSNSLFMYYASVYIPATLLLPPLTVAGEIVLVLVAVFAGALAISLLRRSRYYLKHLSQLDFLD